MARVLVTDGRQRSALAVVRSLGAVGHDVFVCSGAAHSLAASSRHARQSACVSPALAAPERFVADVGALVRRWGIEILLPVTEASSSAILAANGHLGDVLVPMPAYPSFARICRKPLVLETAAKLGIRVPQQKLLSVQPGTAESQVMAAELAADRAFPLVLKPAASVVADGNGQRKAEVWHARDQDDFLRVMESLRPAVFPLLLQERVRGPGVGVFLLLWDNEILASFGHRRIREKPPSGGASVDRESIALDPALVDRSVALLRAFDWRGVAMVEYKIDARSGTPVLMEINGRFWGSLQLAVDAGVDFPVLLLDAALGRPQPPVTSYRVGVRSRWFWGDVDQLLRVLRHSPAELNLEPGVRKSRVLADFLAASWQARSEVFRVADPAPGFVESWDWMRRRGRDAYRKLSQSL